MTTNLDMALQIVRAAEHNPHVPQELFVLLLSQAAKLDTLMAELRGDATLH